MTRPPPLRSTPPGLQHTPTLPQHRDAHTALEKKSRWKSAACYGTMPRVYPRLFGLQAAGAGSDLPEEWQALLASQASTLAALLSRVQTTAATLR